MPNFVPLHCHTHYSLLDGLSRPSQILSRCQELEYKACAITDHGSISGCIDFHKVMTKGGVKAIKGCELYISKDSAVYQNDTNRKHSHLVVLAKNLEGWKTLIKIVSESNQPCHFYYKPRLSLSQLRELCDGNLIGFSGHLGSCLANAANSTDGEWYERSVELCKDFMDIFGRENFFVEIQNVDGTQEILNGKLRKVARDLDLRCIATADSHYATKQQADDHRILLCSSIHKTLRDITTAVKRGEDVPLSGFFKHDTFHIPTVEELLGFNKNTEDEIENTCYVDSLIDSYDVLGKPILPVFDCPAGYDADHYLRHLCEEGWQRLNIPDTDEYRNRLNKELGVLLNAGLSPYFLIVQDFVNWARHEEKMLLGPGRGSGAGCLVSYLLGITLIDPIPSNLIFERFYNAGRNTVDRVSLPDIDVDFPVSKRGDVIGYIRRKYGYDCVSQIVTFSRMQGKSAMKDVLRAMSVPFDEMNAITECFPEEADIADELQEMDEPSIIRWTLENRPGKLSNWCELNGEKLEGEYAGHFKQAMRLEQTKRGQSKHASGIIIAGVPLQSICPMIYDAKSHNTMCGYDMIAAEDVGLVKFDILGVAILDRLMGVQETLMHVGI